MDINMDVEASTDEFEEYDEEFYLKLQNDVSNPFLIHPYIYNFTDYWVPKLNILHHEGPTVVQLNLGKFGSGPQLTSNNVSFDVYYIGTEIQSNRSVLEEIVHNLNLNQRQYIYTGTSAHIHKIKSKLIRSDKLT
ncbi:hypothetical protein PHET_06383 [Paragonimus heterotremus]|uniref:Uncharacterized protein n=1 Tax=Paragonimus heterotremus TaxID=100268 RepID=A0A8J4WZL0_9TREM|nr:hypothetical protein PHET_06383 [Paragonimus heterotremus]